ncbi:L,D-transpeptidase family protein [Sphingomonas sp.]|uniref:L,D-transpeptidase family protein n=1 Tax=Sphingomonas sp. TaxID=28214 RepID=UPI0025CD6B95|nr:L,D-transpeptidase family protein [Sphingomonas sp.]
MTAFFRCGVAVCLALFSVPLASCGTSGEFTPDALQAEVREPAARAFYEARDWQAAWDRAAQKTLLQALRQAPAHGLRQDMFLEEPLPKDRAEREAALTGAAIDYASALARGYADPAKVGKIYTLPRPKPDIAAALARAVEQGQLEAWLESLAPATEEYRALSRAYLHYLAIAAENRVLPPPIAPGKALKPGGRDARLPAIVAALEANGYLPRADDQRPPPPTYSGAVVDAVKRMQGDYGLKVDGVIGIDTVNALNTGPGDRARQLAVALERLRWLDRDPPPTRIDVNTGAAFLDYWRDGRHSDRRNVVVGEPGWETPQLASPIFQLVANPMWRVPDSIYEDELEAKGPGYFAEQHMEWRNGRLVQLPGPKNALGKVKLDMHNKHAIYLHDTPAKALFGQPERHRSHGCVRVEDAIGFALMLAVHDGVQAKFQEALVSADETFVKLKTQIPVRLLYHTAFFDGGRVQLRPDIYGWDDDVARALGLGRVKARPVHKHQPGDVGP